MKWGEKKPEREEKEEEERSGRKAGLGLNGRKLDASHPSAKIYGAELGAKVTDVELPAMSPSTSASSQGARRQGRWRRDVLARRQHQWRRAKGPYSEIFPPGVYL